MEQPLTSWSLYEFNTLYFLSRRVTVGSVLGGVATLLLLFGVALTYVRYQRTRDIRSVIRSLTGRAGTIQLNRRGEVTSANQKARELLRAGYEPRRHEGHEMEFGGPTQGHQTESGDETAGTHKANEARRFPGAFVSCFRVFVANSGPLPCQRQAHWPRLQSWPGRC